MKANQAKRCRPLKIASFTIIGIALWLGSSAARAPQRSAVSIATDLLGTMEELVDVSPVIVDVSVQSVFPATVSNRNGHPRLETDALLRVNRLLKGSERAELLVLAQSGGVAGTLEQLPTQYSLMQPGERYILFLTADNAQKIDRPIRAAPRYAVSGAFAGLLRLTGDKTLVSSAMPAEFRARYDGRNPLSVLADIQSHIGLVQNE